MLTNSSCKLIDKNSSSSSIVNSGASNSSMEITNSTLLKDIYKDYFSFGAAIVNTKLHTSSNVYDEILNNFNSTTAEYEMKWRTLEPKEGEYNYDLADTIISWAKENDISVRGHCLLWYKSLPTWLKDKNFTKYTGLTAIDKHVKKTMSHFGDSVYCWDVLNEALKSTVTIDDLRKGTYYRTGDMTESSEYDWFALAGIDYIQKVFQSANEAKQLYNLDNVDLFYNDFGLENPNKREACVQLVEMLRYANIQIDGIGMQGHLRLQKYLENKVGFLKNFEDSIKRFTELGLDVHMTELDVRVYDVSDIEDKYGDKLPKDVELQQAELYGEILRICRQYSTPWKQGAGRISNVTVWGLADNKNSWDTEMYKEHPLLFDRNFNPKEAYHAISSFNKN